MIQNRTSVFQITQNRPILPLALFTSAMVLLSFWAGAAASQGDPSACAGWPLCSGGIPTSPAAWAQFSHRLSTLGTGISITILFLAILRKHRENLFLLTSISAMLTFFLGEVLLGAYNPDRLAHSLLPALILVISLALVVFSTLPGFRVYQSALPAIPIKFKLIAIFQLNKPIIVALLLVTTYAGMVVAAGRIPSAGLTLWTLLGGALAAGGSSAINQYIDRNLDNRMQRTARRPIPAGLVTPAEALAYGVSACLASMMILYTMVNPLTALLSLAGAVYYVLLYSIWLKKLTVQNIVIGGGAGAIPPMVGWAAITGDLSLAAWFLFLIIFLWTPPHFWSLAIVRKNDYARAGVPMLPVIRGEKETRRQIFVYTIFLVAFSFLGPLVSLGGTVYLVLAGLLGGWLILSALRVFHGEGNKTAWKMYRVSSMYLAFLFLAMVMDVLL